MIQVAPQMRILLAVQPVDFRKGIDGLAQLCRQHLQTDPMSGVVVVFSNRRRRGLKILVYDGQGFWLCHKRLSCGRLGWWPHQADGRSLCLDAHQLQMLLWNGDPQSAKAAPMWRSITPRM